MTKKLVEFMDLTNKIELSNIHYTGFTCILC